MVSWILAEQFLALKTNTEVIISEEEGFLEYEETPVAT